jgi:deazaflavin-dependent oxidoreductase (nitroreductase family)
MMTMPDFDNPNFDNPTDPAVGWAAQHVHDYVATDGAHPSRGHDWREGAPVLLLTTIGRTSGKARRTPLIYGRDGANYLIVGSNGGTPEPPTWYENIQREPRVRIQVRGDIIEGTARTATDEEKPRLWEIMNRIWHYYAGYQKKTKRPIPVVVIEPANGPQG